MAFEREKVPEQSVGGQVKGSEKLCERWIKIALLCDGKPVPGFSVEVDAGDDELSAKGPGGVAEIKDLAVEKCDLVAIHHEDVFELVSVEEE